MSIFSKIKGASKAAKEHKKANAPDTARQNSTPAPYHHVPTHAAIDAMLGAPSSWKEVDRSAIKAQAKRRSMMPRNDSSSSSVSLNRNLTHGFYGSQNNSTNKVSDYGVELGRLEPRKSYTNYTPYHPSRLASYGISPAISEVDASSSSSSAEPLETVYAPAKHPSTQIPHDTSNASRGKLGDAPWLMHLPPPTFSEREPAVSAIPMIHAPIVR